MILILTDQLEPTTDLIISWLLRLNKQFLRISVEDIITIEELYTDQESIEIEMKFSIQKSDRKIQIDTKEIISYWYRRSVLGWQHENKTFNFSLQVENAMKEFLLGEKVELVKTLNFILNRKSKLNKFEDCDLLKFQELHEANSVGLKIPRNLVGCTKESIIKFKTQIQGEIVTKPIGNTTAFFDLGMHTFTTVLDENSLPDFFSYSKVQNAIKKKFELRIFFFDNRFFSSAIFSQESEKTKVDLKNGDSKNPNRIVPFILPSDIEKKLQQLMLNLKLNSGSIDMIVDNNDEFIFLEVNPVGQFEQVSFPCNYQLDYLIADFL